MTQKHTVNISFVHAALQNVSATSRNRVLAMANIPVELLGIPASRISAQSFSALWLAIANELDDEFFGLDSRRMKVGSFALLCHAVVHSANIGSALRRSIKSFSIFLDEIEAVIILAKGKVRIRIINRIRDHNSRRFADETLLVMIHGVVCWLSGCRIPLIQATFAYPKPEHADEYKIMFTSILEFDAEYTELWFDGRVLANPVVQTEGTLKRFLQSAPQSVFLRYKNEDSCTAQIRKRLRGNHGDGWPTLEELAGQIRITPSKLRRRLESEGVSFQLIKDSLRRDIAIHHLSQGRMTIGDIAAELGFQDATAFHRAFKRWTGSQPGQYRSLHDSDSAHDS